MSVSFCDPHDVPLLLGKPLCLRDLMGVCTPSSNRLGTGLQYSLKHRSGVVQSFVVDSRNRTTASLVSRRKMRKAPYSQFYSLLGFTQRIMALYLVGEAEPNHGQNVSRKEWCPGRESYATTDTTNRSLSLAWWHERSHRGGGTLHRYRRSPVLVSSPVGKPGGVTRRVELSD